MDTSILKKYLDNAAYQDILEKYSEPWRHYHTIDHVMDIVLKVERYIVSPKEKMILILAAIFHDVIYYPWNKSKNQSNEYLSAEYFKEWYLGKYNREDEIYHAVRTIIINTETHKSLVKGDLSDKFNNLDTEILFHTSFTEVLKYEHKIYKEFSMASTKQYKKGRMDFLNGLSKASDTFLELKDYVEEFRPKVGFIAGSFNPFHKGHLNILEQSKKVFDKVVILIGQNSDKADINDADERKMSIFKKTACEVRYFDGFLTSYLKKRSKLEDVYLIRGIRNSSDLEYEQTNVSHMKILWSELNVMYLTCPVELAHISSSAIRGLNKIEPNKGNEMYIPEDLF